MEFKGQSTVPSKTLSPVKKEETKGGREEEKEGKRGREREGKKRRRRWEKAEEGNGRERKRIYISEMQSTMDLTSADSTKPDRKYSPKPVTVEHVQTLLILLPKQYGLSRVYIVLVLFRYHK